MTKLSPAQEKILAMVRRYPKGIMIDLNEHRTAKALAKKGLIEYDERTGIAKLTADQKETVCLP